MAKLLTIGVFLVTLLVMRTTALPLEDENVGAEKIENEGHRIVKRSGESSEERGFRGRRIFNRVIPAQPQFIPRAPQVIPQVVSQVPQIIPQAVPQVPQVQSQQVFSPFIFSRNFFPQQFSNYDYYTPYEYYSYYNNGPFYGPYNRGPQQRNFLNAGPFALGRGQRNIRPGPFGVRSRFGSRKY